jgi:hypothetical protein
MDPAGAQNQEQCVGEGQPQITALHRMAISS